MQETGQAACTAKMVPETSPNIPYEAANNNHTKEPHYSIQEESSSTV